MFKKVFNHQLMSVPVILSSCVVFFLVGMETHRKMIAMGSSSVGSHTVTGPASIITDHKELSKLRKGDIVVTYATDTLSHESLQLSAGIITEKGGQDSHAALLGKKLNIPVIVGVSEATQKINEGSFIELDCSNKTVYAIDKKAGLSKKNIPCIPAHCPHAVEPRTSSSGWFSSWFAGSDKGYDLQHTDDNNHHSSHLVKKLRDYVIKKIAPDIGKAKASGKAGKTMAYYIYGISYYAFDAIPFEFFADAGAMTHTFERFEEHFTEAVAYIQALTEKCKAELGGKMDQSKLAEILYKEVVNKIKVSDELREILIKEPLKMDEFVREGIVPKDEYMDLTLRNFNVRCELEELFGSK